MFERLERMPDDPILGLMAAFRADPDTRKVDLGVGVYRNDRGETPVLEAVRQAEQAVLARQTEQDLRRARRECRLQPGDGAAGVRRRRIPTLKAGRVRTIQAPGGCGALARRARS